MEQIKKVVEWFAADESHNIVYTFHNEKQNKDVYMVALRENGQLIGYYEKHEYRNAETMNTYDLFASRLQSVLYQHGLNIKRNWKREFDDAGF